MEDTDVEAIAWKNARDEDLWIFDKLIVSKRLGYVCGPVGMVVPFPGEYIVRPCVNIPGMGKDASFRYIKDDTKHLPAGHFWCEVFKGRHLSIDYKDGVQVLAVEGTRKTYELWRFFKWEKVEDKIPLPSIFHSLIKKYEYINIEYINGKAIEIHLRSNPDFVYGNSVSYPVWDDDMPDKFKHIPSLKYVESPEFRRKGFYID